MTGCAPIVIRHECLKLPLVLFDRLDLKQKPAHATEQSPVSHVAGTSQFHSEFVPAATHEILFIHKARRQSTHGPSARSKNSLAHGLLCIKIRPDFTRADVNIEKR